MCVYKNLFMGLILSRQCHNINCQSDNILFHLFYVVCVACVHLGIWEYVFVCLPRNVKQTVKMWDLWGKKSTVEMFRGNTFWVFFVFAMFSTACALHNSELTNWCGRKMFAKAYQKGLPLFVHRNEGFTTLKGINVVGILTFIDIWPN